MKVKGQFIGRVIADARLVTPRAPSRPFLSYTLQGEKDAKGWGTALECVEYHNRADEKVGSIREGDLFCVFGDVTAKAYMSKREPGKPVGKLTMFIRDREKLGAPPIPDGAEHTTTTSTTQSLPPDEGFTPRTRPQPQPSAAGNAAPEQPQGEGDDCPY